MNTKQDSPARLPEKYRAGLQPFITREHHFCKYNHTKPVESSAMNSDRF